MTARAATRVRIPPSPTGYCHVGTARMALLNFIFAKKMGGEIIFRSEDTDRDRSEQRFEQDIVESLTWLGITWDEFHRQSERLSTYAHAIERLLADDKAYLSREQSKRDANAMVDVIRLRNPGSTITFTDIVRGDITFDTTDLGDFAIARAKRDPLYHLAAVVDDAEMRITHVIRGEEHISNTPRQILIQQALGYDRPQYAHYPLFLGSDKSKLSKRRGDVAVREYRSQGFLPNALINFIATLGWTPPSQKEILDLEEIIAEFELSDLHKSGAVFDVEKLRWFNRQYVARMDPRSFAAYARARFESALSDRGLPVDNQLVAAVLPVLQERISVSSDVDVLVGGGEMDLFFDDPILDPSLIPDKRSTAIDAARHLRHVQETLDQVSESEWSASRLKQTIWEYASQEGRGNVLWPLRYSLSGRTKSPDPFVIAEAIGKRQTLSRVKDAIHRLAV